MYDFIAKLFFREFDGETKVQIDKNPLNKCETD
jgi:hypothetical protein